MSNTKKSKKVHVISDIDDTITKNPEFVGDVDSNDCVIDFLQKKAKQGAEITYISFRNEFLREHTMNWFEKHHLPEGKLMLGVFPSKTRGKEIIPHLCREDEQCIYLDDNKEARKSAHETLGTKIKILDPLECDKFALKSIKKKK